MSSNINTEVVTNVHHWNDKLFSFKTTRSPSFRFENGHFTMLGLPNESKPLMRAYSIASANHEEEMEFFSIKVPDGKLTSKLQHLKIGDEILLGKKPTGTLTLANILPGKNLYLLATGTGLAPFISIIKDPEVYDQFEKIILVHGVRHKSELAYAQLIEQELPKHPYIGEQIKNQLHYYPTVTREPYKHNGRITDLIHSGKIFSDLQFEKPNLQDDRFLICGNMVMIKDTLNILSSKGFHETRGHTLGQIAIERAFVG